MQTSFVDFLNHGTLPFAGRNKEQERILRFWRSPDVDHSELRIALLLGEAGSGKSRLIDEMIPVIETHSGVVVHVKLRPEGSTSLAPLIGRGIDGSASARELGQQRSDQSLSSAIATLRRLCSLRRTIMIIEDIHLLSGPTLREFSLLVEALADEPLALLVAARPLELSARGIVEGYLGDEIVLGGLSMQEVGGMWKEVFSSEPPQELLDALMVNTQGNALAIRSALRGSIRSGCIVEPQFDKGWEIQINIGTFAEIVRRSVNGIVDGIVADLSSEQLEAARQLSLLGEAFSIEAARLMIDDAVSMIESLIFKGIISHATTPINALNDTQSNSLPIAFTHTLLHNALSERAALHSERMVRVIASGSTIYSLLPFRWLVEEKPFFENPANEAIAAIEQLCEIAGALDESVNWQDAQTVMAAAEQIALSVIDNLDQLPKLQLESLLVTQKLRLLRRSIVSPIYRELASDLYRMTQGSDDPLIRERHINAIRFLMTADIVKLPVELYDPPILDEAIRLVSESPSLRSSESYLDLLDVMSRFAANNAAYQHPLLLKLERIVDTLVHDPELSEESREKVFIRLAGASLGLADTPEQLETKRQTEERLRRLAGPDDLAVHISRMKFLSRAGEWERLVAELPPLIRRLRERGLIVLADSQGYTLYITLGMSGYPLSDILARVQDLRASQRRQEQGKVSIVGASLCYVALLRGDLEFASIFASEFPGLEARAQIDKRFLYTLWKGEIDEALTLSRELPEDDEWLRRLASVSLGEEDQKEAVVDEYLDKLISPPLTVFSFSRIYAGLWLIDHGLGQGRIARSESLLASIHRSVEGCLEWFAERNLFACIAPLLDRHGCYLDEKEVKRWRTRIASMEEDYRKRYQKEKGKLYISMIETITIRQGEDPPQRLRGGRNQTVLALLVANAMIKKPLDRVTFLSLATGITDDPERARTTWNVAALRLREAIGKDALLMDDNVPMLNRDAVHIDLLEAWEFLARADSALRRHRLVDASEACLNVLNLAAGKVIFPTLYDELFETLRDDFENRLRQTTLSTAMALAEAGDMESTESLLRHYNAAIPDDQESAELLATILARQNRSSESLLIRARANEQLDA